MTSNIKANTQGLAILRISSYRQEDGYSHDVQEQEIRAYAKENNIDLIQVIRIIESAKSAEDRKKYKAAIEAALKDKIYNLLFYQLDREARNNSDLEQNERLVLAGKIAIHYVRDRKVLTKSSPDSEFLSRDIQGAINKQYSRILSAKVLDAMDHKAQKGVYPSNNVPLGYKVVALLDENGVPRKRGTNIAVDHETKNLVIKEFELRAKGYSVASVRKETLTLGLVPAKKRKTYSQNALEARLKSPFYRGRFLWRGTEYQGSHELFVPMQLVQKVDRSFGLRGYTKKNLVGLFSGWVRCGHAECGCQLTYDAKTKYISNGETRTYRYYHCANGKRVHESMKGLNVKEDRLLNEFEGVFDAVSIEESFAQQIAEAMNGTIEDSRKALEQEIHSERRKREEIDLKLGCLTDKLVDGILDNETFKLGQQKLLSDKRRSEERQEMLSLQIHDSAMETARSILELATKAKTLWLSRSVEERRALLELLVSNPMWDGSTLRYDLKKPFQVLAGMKKNSEWRTRLGSNQ